MSLIFKHGVFQGVSFRLNSEPQFIQGNYEDKLRLIQEVCEIKRKNKF